QGAPSLQEGTDGIGLPTYTATNHVLHFTMQTTGVRRSDWMSVPVPTGWPPVPPGTTPPTVARNQLELQGPSDFQQGSLMLSQWSEVIWFLWPMTETDPATGNPRQLTATVSDNPGVVQPVPLWSLHRRQRLILDGNNANINRANLVPSANWNYYPEVSCRPQTT